MTVLRYTSYKDVYRIFIAILASSFLLYFTNNLLKSIYINFGIKNFVIVLDFLLILIFIIGYRVFIRYAIKQSVENSKNLIPKKIVIIGTEYQSILIKHFLDYESEIYKYEVFAYFTNDQKLIGKKIENKPIFHINELKSYLAIQKIDTLIVSKYKEFQYFIEDISDYCEKMEIDIVNSENLKKWISNKKSISYTPSFQIEDLLQRTPIELDIKNISAQLTNKKILVTGAAGSIGSELCRQILKLN
jgi:FlaA1/EpsC-like NDP-sugar epimerase